MASKIIQQVRGQYPFKTYPSQRQTTTTITSYSPTPQISEAEYIAQQKKLYIVNELKAVDERIYNLQGAKTSIKQSMNEAFGRSDSKTVNKLQDKMVAIDDQINQLAEKRYLVERGEVSASDLASYSQQYSEMQKQRDIARADIKVAERQAEFEKKLQEQKAQKLAGRGVYYVEGAKGIGLLSTRTASKLSQQTAEQVYYGTEGRKKPVVPKLQDVLRPSNRIDSGYYYTNVGNLAVTQKIFEPERKAKLWNWRTGTTLPQIKTFTGVKKRAIVREYKKDPSAFVRGVLEGAIIDPTKEIAKSTFKVAYKSIPESIIPLQYKPLYKPAKQIYTKTQPLKQYQINLETQQKIISKIPFEKNFEKQILKLNKARYELLSKPISTKEAVYAGLVPGALLFGAYAPASIVAGGEYLLGGLAVKSFVEEPTAKKLGEAIAMGYPAGKRIGKFTTRNIPGISEQRTMFAKTGELIPLRERKMQVENILEGIGEEAITSRRKLGVNTLTNAPLTSMDYTFGVPIKFATTEVGRARPSSKLFLKSSEDLPLKISKGTFIGKTEILKKGKGFEYYKFAEQEKAMIRRSLEQNQPIKSSDLELLYKNAQKQATLLSKQRGRETFVATISPKRARAFQQPEFEMALVSPLGKFKPHKMKFAGISREGGLVFSQQSRLKSFVQNLKDFGKRQEIAMDYFTKLGLEKESYLFGRKAYPGEYGYHGFEHLVTSPRKFQKKFKITEKDYMLHKYHDIVKVSEQDTFAEFPHGETAGKLFDFDAFNLKLSPKEQRLWSQAFAGHEYYRPTIKSLFQTPGKGKVEGLRIPDEKQLYYYALGKVNPKLRLVSSLDRLDFTRFGMGVDERFLAKEYRNIVNKKYLNNLKISSRKTNNNLKKYFEQFTNNNKQQTITTQSEANMKKYLDSYGIQEPTYKLKTPKYSAQYYKPSIINKKVYGYYSNKTKNDYAKYYNNYKNKFTNYAGSYAKDYGGYKPIAYKPIQSYTTQITPKSYVAGDYGRSQGVYSKGYAKKISTMGYARTEQLRNYYTQMQPIIQKQSKRKRKPFKPSMYELYGYAPDLTSRILGISQKVTRPQILKKIYKTYTPFETRAMLRPVRL